MQFLFRIISSPILVLTLITICSCDPTVQYSQVIDNASDHELTLIMFPDTLRPFLNYEFDTLVIPKQTEVVIVEDFHIGKTSSHKDCDVPLDSFSVFVDGIDSLTLKTNIINSNLWRFRVLDKGGAGSGTCECRLIITNDSIQ